MKWTFLKKKEGFESHHFLISDKENISSSTKPANNKEMLKSLILIDDIGNKPILSTLMPYILID
jgi:hypothetical protein